MFISIIIPVYNVEHYLHDCLNTVFQQSFTDYEVICINDGSTDRSLEILEEFQKKYNQINIITQKNKGLSGARNTGIHAAIGTYILFLDSDDMLEKDALKILSDHVSSEDMFCFNARKLTINGIEELRETATREYLMTGWKYYNEYSLITSNIHFACVWQRIYNRNFLNENNMFFEEGIYHEDNLFTPYVCYYAKTVKVITDCLYIYRIREGSIMQSVNFKRICDIITVANKLSNFFIPLKELDKRQLYREIAGDYFGAFISDNIKLYGNRDKEIKKMIKWQNFKAVSIYPRHKRIYYLLSVAPVFFRAYFWLEQSMKFLRTKY